MAEANDSNTVPLLVRHEHGHANQFPSPRKPWTIDRLQKFKRGLEHPTTGHMISLVLLFGTITGVVAVVYSSFFEKLLDVVWETFPSRFVSPLLHKLHSKYSGFPEPDRVAWVYIPVVAALFGLLAGVVQWLLGFPGDLPGKASITFKTGL